MKPVTPLLTSARDAQAPTAEPPPLGTAPAPLGEPAKNDRPSRHDSEWRRTIASVREMLAGLDRTGDASATDEQQKQKRSKAAAWVSSLVEKLVAAATAEREAAVKRTRAEADIDIAQMQALVIHLRSESEFQREEISRLQERLEAEKAKNARLAAAFEAVQRAASFVEPIEPALRPASPAPQTSEHTTPAESRPLKLVSTTSGAASDPALVEYVKQLLDQIESRYWTDLGAAMGPADIVDR